MSVGAFLLVLGIGLVALFPMLSTYYSPNFSFGFSPETVFDTELTAVFLAAVGAAILALGIASDR